MATVVEPSWDVKALLAENAALKAENKDLKKRLDDLLQREREREGERDSNSLSIRELQLSLDASLGLDGEESTRSMASDTSSSGAGGKHSRWHGLKPRPELAKRICAHKKEKSKDPRKKKTVMQRVEENHELLESFEYTAGVLETLIECQEVDWPDDIPYLPLAERLRDAAIPRLSYDKFAAMIEDCQDAVILELEHGTEEKYGGVEEFWPLYDDVDPFICNKKATEEFGTAEDMMKWRAEPRATTRWRDQIRQAFTDSIFQDGDMQPFRESFFQYGKLSHSQDWNPAQMKLMVS